MSLQINLLKKSERRYQGIVSMKVMVLGSVSVFVGITILGLALAGISRMTLRTNLERARREWSRIQPRAAELRAGHVATAANRAMLKKLESWAQGEHPSLHEILYAVQSRVPRKMELDSLRAGFEQLSDEEPVYSILRMSGRAQGELTAVNAKRHFNEEAALRNFCGEVKLVSSKREAGDVWSFAFEGRREMEGDAP